MRRPPCGAAGRARGAATPHGDALSLRGAVPPHRLETRGGIPYSRRPHPHELTDHQHVRPNREATDELQRMSSTNNLRDWVELEAGPSQGMS